MTDQEFLDAIAGVESNFEEAKKRLKQNPSEENRQYFRGAQDYYIQYRRFWRDIAVLAGTRRGLIQVKEG